MAKPKITKGQIDIDLTGVEASERRRKALIPEGEYRAKVVSATGKKFGTGSRGVEWVVEVTDSGKGKGARFWYNNVLIDSEGQTATSSLWSFRGFLQSLSPTPKIPDRLVKISLTKMVNRTLGIEVADGEDGEGKIRSEIIDVFNEEQLSDDEDDEVEEDEEEEDELEDDEDEIDLDEDEL